MLPHCNERDAFNKAQKLREQITAVPFEKFSITASIGIACLPKDGGCDFKGLFELADKALYMAKVNGRNRIELSVCKLKSRRRD